MFLYCEGIELIFIFGYMFGYVSFYLRKLKILVVGDVLVLVNGWLMGFVK